MNPNEFASRNVAVMGAIDPDAAAAGTYTTPWLSVAMFHSFMCLLMAGTLGTNATIDAKVEQAQDVAGTGAKDLTGKAITQLTQAGDDDSDQQAMIEFVQSELDLQNDFTHVRFSVTVGTAACDIAGVVFGLAPREVPASDGDAASVAEIAA